MLHESCDNSLCYQLPKVVTSYGNPTETEISKYPGIIMCMGPANERRCYSVTPSLIGLAYTQNDPWKSH